MIEHIKSNLQEAQVALNRLLDDEGALRAIANAGDLLANSLKNRKHVYSCGNGGSMCDAMHFAEELSGRFRDDRPALGAIAISDSSHITCTGNDFGFEQIFARFIEAQGREGDVLLAISTSGTSKNVVAAAKTAKAIGMKVIALTGKTESTLGELADVTISTVGGRYADRVQELHIKVIHILIELVERKTFNLNYER